jgi:hypothetical protein
MAAGALEFGCLGLVVFQRPVRWMPGGPVYEKEEEAMKLQSKRRLTTFFMLLGMFAFVAAASAGPKVKKHNHHSAHEMVAAKLKTDGTHQIHKNGKHTVSATVKNGKIAGVHVKHDTKGEVAVKKYKTNKKMAVLDGTPSETQPADDLGTVWIGYAYVDDEGVEEYYWFPYEEILDGDTGAVEYVPLS